MASYQVIRIYNRLPYTVDYQWDQRPGTIKAHSHDVVVYDMAVAAIKASVIYMDPDDLNEVEHGVVPERDPGFDVPLTQEEVDAIQDIPGWQMGVRDATEYETRTFKNPEARPVARRRASAKVAISASSAGGEDA